MDGLMAGDGDAGSEYNWIINTESNPSDQLVIDGTLVDHATRLLFAIDVIGRVGTLAIDEQVGAEYSSNATLGTLGALAHGGAQRPRDVESVVGATSATVTRILTQLEAQGDIVRLPGRSPDDGRATMLHLTEKGRAVERSIASAWGSCGVELGVPLSIAVDELTEIVSFQGTSPPEPIESSEELCLAFGRLGMLLTENLTSSLAQIETNGALVLCLLHESDVPIRPILVSKRLDLTSGGTSKLLDRMEKAGFVRRTYGSIAQDRRGVEVALTAEGHERLVVIASRIVDQSVELLHAFEGLTHVLATHGL